MRGTEAQGRLVQLVAGILSGIQGVVGEGASQALLRYGAYEQGRRLAFETTSGALDQAIQSVDQVLGQSSHGTREATGAIRIHLEASPIVAASNPMLDTLIIGLYEGLLSGVYQSRFKGSIGPRGANGAAVLEFQVDRT